MVKKECLEGHYVENLVARTSAAAEIYKRALLFFQIKYLQKNTTRADFESTLLLPS